MSIRNEYELETGRRPVLFPCVVNRTLSGFERSLRDALEYIDWLELRASKGGAVDNFAQQAKANLDASTESANR